jgi:uncharacterized protein YqeY
VSELAVRLHAALTASRKAQQKDRVLVLGTLLAQVRNREIEVDRSLTDADVIDVFRKGVKTRRESIEAYQKAGRPDLAQVEQAQIVVLEEFLPPDIDPEEIRIAVRQAISGGATDVGKIMGQVMPAFKGRADGKVINQIVRDELARV